MARAACVFALGGRQVDMVVTGERWLSARPGQRGADPNAAVISTRSLLAPHPAAFTAIHRVPQLFTSTAFGLT
jgi:hypothetical protein